MHVSIIPHLLQDQWSMVIPKGRWILGVRGCVGGPELQAAPTDNENWRCRIMLMSGMNVKKVYEATTVPGKPYVQRGLSGRGGAQLIPGAYQYRAGLHKGTPAYVENQKLALFRNANKDWMFNPMLDPLEVSSPGIHLHYGGGSQIKNWSAGCQVVNVKKDSADYKTFYTWTTKLKYILAPFSLLERGSLDKRFRCLMLGSEGSLVGLAQKALKAPITEVYGLDFLKYVQAYQRHNNMSPDTLIGPGLLTLMKI